MKKSWLYIFLIILMADYACFNQAFKLPALVCHFIEHRELDNRVGIMEYLSMHYWGEDLNDNDQDKDMQLPFKKFNTHSSFQLAIPVSKPTVERQQFSRQTTAVSVLQQDHLINRALDALFRPPRA